MTELRSWLQREASRQAARPELLAAMLSGRGFAYARHRLGFMAVRMLLRSGLHALEIQLLMAAFLPWEYLAPLIAYRALCAIAGAAHWGALEPLRARVREATAKRQPGAARRAIEAWLGLTLAAAALAVSVMLVSLLSSGHVALQGAYGFACVLRLALDSSLRVLHSGVFALRRVHRPLWSSLAPDLLELALIALGFAQLGVWSIPLATLLGGACDALLTFVYVRRAYRQRRLPLPSPWRAPSALRTLTGAQLSAAGVHGLAGVALQLDGLLLLLLVQSGRGGWFAALYYVLRPLMAASTHWVRAFYFDLKLLEAGPLSVFRPRFLRFVERLGIVWALGLALITLGLLRQLAPGQELWPLLWLLPFFVARSAFALAQLAAFGAARLPRLLQVSAFVLLGLVACRAFGLRDLQLLAASSLLLAAAAGWAGFGRERSARAQAAAGVQDLGTFLAWLRSAGRVQLALLRVDARRATVGGVLHGLRVAYPSAALTRWGRRHVMLALPEGATSLARRELIVACAGTLGRLWVSALGEAARAFEHARQAGALPDGWAGAEQRCRSALSLGELARQFRAQFAQGTFCDLGAGHDLRVRAANGAILRALVNSLQARSRGREARSERELPFQLAVYAPGGRASALFIAPRSAPEFDAFRACVRDASLRASWPELFEQAPATTQPDGASQQLSVLRS